MTIFQQVHESESSNSSVETVQDLHLVMGMNNIYLFKIMSHKIAALKVKSLLKVKQNSMKKALI